MPSSRARPRRDFLRLLGAGTLGLAGAAVVGCGDGAPVAEVAATERALAPRRARPVETLGESARPMLTRALAPVAPTPRPVPPAARIERVMLGGTEWETPLLVTHSGVEGHRMLVLGGVHGNEPGGFLAAEEIATWGVDGGSLLVVPRANVLATRAVERTLPRLGDLNRLYPGDPGHVLPMARMAHEIMGVIDEFAVDLVLDLHESWAFYNERSQDSRASLGQTVAKGRGPVALETVEAWIETANAQTSTREQLVMRNRFAWVPPDPPAVSRAPHWSEVPDAFERRFTSSLGIGALAEGVTPVLIEMGQQDQPLWRRSELHQLFVRSVLQHIEML